MASCIDLRERFGGRYRVLEEDMGRRARKAADPWLFVLPCRLGFICPWGGDNLAACTNRPGRTASRLKAMPFVTVAQDGDDGVNVAFPVERFAAVARIMHPRRRRLMSEQQRRLLLAAGAGNCFRVTTALTPQTWGRKRPPSRGPWFEPWGGRKLAGECRRRSWSRCGMTTKSAGVRCGGW